MTDKFLIELSLSAMQINGKLHAIEIVRDITERKQVEDSLRNSAESLQAEVINAHVHAHDYLILRTACAAGQAAATGALAHKLKSSARSVGALVLGELCVEIEKSGKAGDTEALVVLLPKFEQELAGVEGFLEWY